MYIKNNTYPIKMNNISSTSFSCYNLNILSLLINSWPQLTISQPMWTGKSLYTKRTLTIRISPQVLEVVHEMLRLPSHLIALIHEMFRLPSHLIALIHEMLRLPSHLIALIHEMLNLPSHMIALMHEMFRLPEHLIALPVLIYWLTYYMRFMVLYFNIILYNYDVFIISSSSCLSM